MHTTYADSTQSSHSEHTMDLSLAERTTVADSVVQLTLRHPQNDELPAWTPGAHLDLAVAPGIVRQYSLCGDPSDRSAYTVAVLREPESRGGSLAVHESLQVGDRLEVVGPRNNFELQDADEYLFIAGGIGITPLIPMIAAAHQRGKPFELLYGGRTRHSMAYVDELESTYRQSVHVRPQDEFGHLDLPSVLGSHTPSRAIYTCGPAPLLDAIETYCQSWPSGSVNMERFRGTAFTPDPAGTSFEIELAQSGMTLTVPPDRSVLDVVEEAGISVLSSCREGTCGSCETPILEGQAEHRDSLLTQDERDAQESMFICVSRPCSRRLVLDL
ncbi:PDR/VanB family oxidoreductase [Rhodococcoides fascians]|uniref:PDR/VanB family oxidoreductase n=1 Tax=Rhodococcoides fascians TaxID=1828 RepID=UPI000691BDED|nr:PDR/VanB family oxidoreductase [Rhodococcus fascians]